MKNLAVCAGLVATAISATGATSATQTITIEAMQFSPAVATVKRGDLVIWVNNDLVPHTVTAAKAFDSGTLAPAKSWRMRPSRPGRYDYVCALHPTMKAVLVVE